MDRAQRIAGWGIVAAVSTLALPSGITVADPAARLGRFLEEEFPYYDGVISADPDRIDPVDVLVTISVNSYINSAAKVRRVHRGLVSACEPLLPSIPHHARLADGHGALDRVKEIIAAAVTVRDVLVPVATKVLHRKRPSLIPMLDSVVINYYADALGRPELKGRKEDKRRAADVAVVTLQAFRSDLLAAADALSALVTRLAARGFPITDVRALEVLIWTELEPNGYYRLAP
jgi:hypothetical protein